MDAQNAEDPTKQEGYSIADQVKLGIIGRPSSKDGIGTELALGTLHDIIDKLNKELQTKNEQLAQLQEELARSREENAGITGKKRPPPDRGATAGPLRSHPAATTS